MKRTLAALVATMSIGGTLGAQAPDAKLVAQGKKLYATYKCDQCHMIAGRVDALAHQDRPTAEAVNIAVGGDSDRGIAVVALRGDEGWRDWARTQRLGP